MSKFQIGMSVWVPHAKYEWVGAEIVDYQEGDADLRVRVEVEDDWDDDDSEKRDEEIRVPVAKVHFKNPDILEGVDDLSTLSHLHEAAILHNLHYRYKLNQIYTYIGKILISINPYTMLPLYGREMITAYFGKQLGTLSPHVYAIAEDAFKDMRYDGQSQSILVAGESGSGKTQCTKYLLQYFASMGNLIKESNNSTASSSSSPLKKSSSSLPNQPQLDTKSIEERVLESTPLLEAFGNAKTLRNDNSSRFGKFIEIHFNEFGSIIGAKILTYLLEKSRIVKQVLNERNYHIFYQVLRGLDEQSKERLHLTNVEDYYYLNQSECLDIDQVSDEETFKETLHAMQVTGISAEEQDNIFKVISVVLLLGNIEFQADPSAANEDSSMIVNSLPLKKVCELLGCPEDEMAATFLKRKVVSGKETFFIGNNKERAENARDSLAMYLYGMLFDWLVMKINSAMSIEHLSGTINGQTGKPQKSKSFIGVLDIYGFESFDVNGLNQFCINYANEKLQQLFNQHVFKEEQQEYIKEKIDWSYIDFNDNQDTLDLIEKKPICITSLLDEETTFPKATPQSLVTKLSSKLSSHSKFEKPRFSNTAFTISHYAGKVTYDTDQFLEKNRDFIIQEQILLLHKSDFQFIKSVLNVPLVNAGIAKPGASSNTSMKFQSVVSQFSASLSSLMKTISQTTPHYIRCIKPNPDKLAQVFNKSDVISQLRCGGIMESVRICTAGFPTRRLLTEFYHRYKLLNQKNGNRSAISTSSNKNNIRDQVESLLKSVEWLTDDKYKIGLTKVFLRAGQLASLEDMRLNTLNHSAMIIQNNWKRYHFQKQYKAIKSAALIIQTKIRSQQAKNQMLQLKRIHAATMIQTAYRRWKEVRAYKKTKETAIFLQTLIRKSLDREMVMNERWTRACTLLQTSIRSALAKKEVAKAHRRIVRIQSLWRCKQARRIYLAVRAEARSLKSVQEARDKLEEKLQDLQWRLSIEVKLKQQTEEDKYKLDKALEEAQNKIDHLELQLSQSSSKYQNLKSNHQSLTDESDEQKKVIDSLTSQLANEKKSLATSEKECLDLKLRISQQESDIKSRIESEQAKDSRLLALESEIAELKQTIQEKDKSYKQLLRENESDAAEFNNQISQLNRSISESQEQSQQLQHQLEEFEEKYTSSQFELDNLKIEMKDKEKEFTEAISKANLIQQETTNELIQMKEKAIGLETSLNAANQKYQTDLTQARFEMQQFQQQHQTTLDSLEQTLEKLKKANETNQKATEKLKKSKIRYQTLEEENKNVILELEKLKLQKSLIEEEKSQISSQLSNSRMESIQNQSSSSKYKDKHKELKDKYDLSIRDLQKSQNDLQLKSEETNRLNLEVADLKKEIIKYSKEISENSSHSSIEKSKLENSLRQLETEKSQIKVQSDQFELELRSVQRASKDQKEQISKLETEIKQLTSIKERFENEFFSIKETSSNNAQESSYLKEITSQMKQNQTRLEKELDEKKSELEKIQDEKDQMKQINDALLISNDRLTTSQQHKDKQIEEGYSQIKEIESQLKDLSGKWDHSKMEITELNKICNDHLSQIQSLESDKKNLKSKYQALKAKNFVKLETELNMARQHSEYIESLINDFKSRNQELSESNQILKSQTLSLQLDSEKLITEKTQQYHEKMKLLDLEKDQQEKVHSQLLKQIQESSEESERLKKQTQQLIKENKELEENSLQIANNLMEVKLDFEKKLTDQESKSKRMSLTLQQSLQETISTQINEMDTMKSKLNTVTEDLLEKNRELQSLQNQYSSFSQSYKELKIYHDKFKDLEEIIDFKESEWERLARIAGNKEEKTKIISDYLLNSKLETNTLAALMWANQIQYWRSFEKKDLSIFKGIIRSIIQFILDHFEDINWLSYLLSCCSLICFIFKHQLKAQNLITPVVPTRTELEDLLIYVDIKTPEDFIIQLENCIGKTYGLLFKIITSSLSPLIEGAILNDNYKSKPGVNSSVNKLMNPLIPLDNIVNLLSSVITTFQYRMIHFTLSQELFNQIFCYIGNYIKQSFLLRQSFCTDEFALFVKQKLDQLTKWANENGDVWVGSIDNAFLQVKEIIAVITLRDKEKLVEEKVRKQICPYLNVNQLKFILSMYHRDEYGGKLPIKLVNAICPADKNSQSQSYNGKQIIDENKLNPIPLKKLHYLELSEIQNFSIPLSTKHTIEKEIQNISLSLVNV